MKQLILVLVTSVFVFSSCSDRVYSYRKTRKVDPNNGPVVQVKTIDKQEKTATVSNEAVQSEENTNEPIVASSGKEPVLMNYVSESSKASEVKTTSSVKLAKQFKAKRHEMKRSYREYKRAYKDTYDRIPFGSTERALIIIGLIFLLIGVVIGIISGYAGWLLVTIGVILIVIGLVLWLINYI